MFGRFSMGKTTIRPVIFSSRTFRRKILPPPSSYAYYAFTRFPSGGNFVLRWCTSERQFFDFLRRTARCKNAVVNKKKKKLFSRYTRDFVKTFLQRRARSNARINIRNRIKTLRPSSVIHSKSDASHAQHFFCIIHIIRLEFFFVSFFKLYRYSPFRNNTEKKEKKSTLVRV